MGDFSNRVFAVVRRIPRGRVATYGQIARIIGAPRSARHVAYALHNNPSPGMDPESIPCHRVVFKNGSVCKGYAFGGAEEQRRMLELEGVGFDDDGRAMLEEHQWNGCMGSDDDAIDWEKVLAEWEIHDCENCKQPRNDCRRN